MEKKKIYFILFSCLFLVLAIALTLVFVVSKNKSNSSNDVLTCYVEDVYMTVGDEVFNYYTINDESAELYFEVNKSNIISIDKNKITGLKPGIVKVSVTAKTENAVTKTEFYVKVFAETYTYNFIPISNCEFDEEIIIITDYTFQFKIEVYNKLYNLVSNPVYQITSNNDDIVIQNNFGIITVSVVAECNLTIIFDNPSASFTKNIKIT